MAIRGTSKADQFHGTRFNDDIYGFEGNDTFFGGRGADRMDGGADIDTVDYNSIQGYDLYEPSTSTSSAPPSPAVSPKATS